MNTSITSLFNDIFSNEHELDFFLKCIEKKECDTTDKECQSEPWLKRLERFYDDFLKTEEGIEYKRWLPVDYDKHFFIEEYMKWFYFFHYFQRRIKAVGNRILFKRLLFFQPLFLTKPFIFYIKRILKLHYFYIYFVDLSKPTVYSLFKELKEFTCYFPWYSGFTLLDNYELERGIDQSNLHMQQYIDNLMEYKVLYDIPDGDKMHLHRFVRFIEFPGFADKEIEPGYLKKFLTEQIKKKIEEGEYLMLMDMGRLYCKRASPFSRSKYCGRFQITGEILVSISVNFCLQDILDKLLEDLREQDLPEIKSLFSNEKFDEIQKHNPYMRRFRENNYEDGYYFSPQTDLFALNKILEELKGMNTESQRTILRHLFRYFVENTQDGSGNKIINYLYKKHKNELKTAVSKLNLLKLLLIGTMKNKKELTAKDVEENQEWEKIHQFLQDYGILYEVRENLGNLLTHFVFRKNLPARFSNFDYSFIGLKLSNLRYILEKQREYTDSSLMFYEIHQTAAFMPLEDYDEKIVRQRVRKTKNFFSSFIHFFAARIVADKMTHFVQQKTTSDVTSRWAHALKTRIEFLKPTVRSLKGKFPGSALAQNSETRNVIGILENRVMELSKISILIYEFSKIKIENYDILKEFNEFVREFPKNPEGFTCRHLVEILQDSITTALVRIITDDVYSVYIEPRKKCLKHEFFTQREIPRSEGSSKGTIMEINPENQNKLIFGEDGLARIDRSSIDTFMQGLYKITGLEGKFEIQLGNELKEYLNYFILEESKIGVSDKRFAMSSMIALLLDEILLNAFKYFDTNKDGERYIKVKIDGLAKPEKNKGYLLPVTIRNSIGEESKRGDVFRDIEKYRTGIESITMGLSLLQKEKRDAQRGQKYYFDIEDGKFFEYRLNIPVFLSGRDWTSEYQSKTQEEMT
jgi:hypothetical protein